MTTTVTRFQHGDTVRKFWSGIAGTVLDTSGDMVHVQFSDHDDWIRECNLEATDRYVVSTFADAADDEPAFMAVDKVERRPIARFFMVEAANEYVFFKNGPKS